VVRSRDIPKCTDRTILLASRRHDSCLVGNSKGGTGKTSETRYLGCGKDKDNSQLHVIIQEGELQQNLLAFNTEKVVTGTR
jgi:hypothetical protein